MLTSKSMMFDGRYIEDQIEGYTTINVTGREMAEMQIDALEVGNRNGAIFRNTKYRPRILTISFILEGNDLYFSPDNTELINRMNKLNGILETDNEVQIIFRDEPDKFYMGIRNGAPETTMALGIIQGSFQIYCADPFKYSVEEFVAEPDPVLSRENGNQTFAIDYQGTHKSYPTFETQFYTQNTTKRVADIQEDVPTDEELSGVDISTKNATSTGNEDEQLNGKGACGYVAFFDDQENILQFGNPEEDGQPDAALIPKALVNQNFQSLGTWSDSTQRQWNQNSGTLPGPTWMHVGEFAIDRSYYNAQSVYTNNTLLSNAAGTSSKYSVSAKCTNRTSTSVKVSVTITGQVTAASPKEKNLVAELEIYDEVYQVTLKSGSNSAKTAWKSGTKVTKTMTFTIGDLSPEQDVIGGIRFQVVTSGGSGMVGRLPWKACNNMNIPMYVQPQTQSYYLTPDPESLGVGTKDKYYGPSIYRDIPADASGNRGWSDFIADFHLKFCTGSTTNDKNQMGAIYVGLLSGTYDSATDTLSNPWILAGVTVRKYQVGNEGYIRAIGNRYYLQTDKKIDLSYYNTYFGNNRAAYTTYKNVTTTKTVTTGTGKNKKKKTVKTTTKQAVKHAATTTNKHIVITKKGSNVVFNVGGVKINWNEANATDKVYRIIVAAYAYSGMPRMDWMGFYNVKFTPTTIDGVETTIPFTTGDNLVAEAATGDVYLNDTLAPELGALGNDWERMYLVPGEINMISTSYSAWAAEDVYRRCNEDDYYDSNAEYFTKSGDQYSPVVVDENTFNSNQSSYYIKETTAPSFRIRYREVYA